MGQDISKPFNNVYDKPIFICTFEEVQKRPMVDAIKVVCIECWEHANDREAVRRDCYHEIDTKWNPHNQMRIFKQVLL